MKIIILMTVCFFRRRKSKEKDNEQSDNSDVFIMQSVKTDEKDIAKDNNDKSDNTTSLPDACNFDFDEIVSIYKFLYLIAFLNIYIYRLNI